MHTDFSLLSEKIDQLAELTHTLRRENAGLRMQAAVLSDEKVALEQRIELAHERVTALMDRLPQPPQPPQSDSINPEDIA